MNEPLYAIGENSLMQIPVETGDSLLEFKDEH